MKAPIIIFAIIIIAAIGAVLYSNQQSNVNSPSASPTPSQSASVPDDLNNAEAYAHPALNYSIQVPENLIVETNGDYSILITPEIQEPGPGPANFIYVSVVTPENKGAEGTIYNYNPTQHQKLLTLENEGQSISPSEGEPPQDEWFTYTRVGEEEIDGNQAIVYENTNPWEFPRGTTETRYIFEANGNTYILGYYTGGGEFVSPSSSLDPRTAKAVIQSFKK